MATNERVIEILRARLHEENRTLRLLIVDDGGEENGHRKGYDQIEALWPGIFEVERTFSWNACNERKPAGLPLIMQYVYDLVLLDLRFDVQPHQGYEILHMIRTGLVKHAEQNGLDLKVAETNQDVYTIGVSTEWDEHIRGAKPDIKPNSWTNREECAPQGLAEKMNQFFREGALVRPTIACNAGNLLELEYYIYHTFGKMPRHCCNDAEYPEFAQRCPVVCPPRDVVIEVWDPIKAARELALIRGDRFIAGYLDGTSGDHYMWLLDEKDEKKEIGKLHLQCWGSHADLRGLRRAS